MTGPRANPQRRRESRIRRAVAMTGPIKDRRRPFYSILPPLGLPALDGEGVSRVLSHGETDAPFRDDGTAIWCGIAAIVQGLVQEREVRVPTMHPERRLPITAGDRHGVPDCSHRRANL
jgi:hypothetical protein